MRSDADAPYFGPWRRVFDALRIALGYGASEPLPPGPTFLQIVQKAWPSDDYVERMRVHCASKSDLYKELTAVTKQLALVVEREAAQHAIGLPGGVVDTMPLATRRLAAAAHAVALVALVEGGPAELSPDVPLRGRQRQPGARFVMPRFLRELFALHRQDGGGGVGAQLLGTELGRRLKTSGVMPALGKDATIRDSLAYGAFLVACPGWVKWCVTEPRREMQCWFPGAPPDVLRRLKEESKKRHVAILASIAHCLATNPKHTAIPLV